MYAKDTKNHSKPAFTDQIKSGSYILTLDSHKLFTYCSILMRPVIKAHFDAKTICQTRDLLSKNNYFLSILTHFNQKYTASITAKIHIEGSFYITGKYALPGY